LVDIPAFSQREGNPYCGPDGSDWPDNYRRFYYFAKVAEAIALNQLRLDWQPSIVHCNDWQTGLIPTLLALHAKRPATIFTIHNLAYRGLFSYQAFAELNLPQALWHHERLEFYGQMSYIKGGLVFADQVTTVSKSYSNEIQTPEFGNGLDGLLRYRKDSLSGILNGIDLLEWNPNTDKLIAHNYNLRTLSKKTNNKVDLQQELGLRVDKDIPMLGFIGRLVDQKGVDLLLEKIQPLLTKDCQLVVLGSGFAHYEKVLKAVAEAHPTQVSVTIGYNEAFAHKIEAASDIFLMPSIFEPCGLNQMYSLRYGTLPIVHAVGGLKDTVFEDTPDAPHASANGFVFHSAEPQALYSTIERALNTYRQKDTWLTLQKNAMQTNFSWEASALEYVALYDLAASTELVD
jgi:starch synthase